ncbi:MAG TPA: hypothetical protein VNC59_04460 [Thermoanaerobaculia bacterium]|nr:hypothetical protein [Thermoanaerobaculia bacterium]
MTEGSGRRPVLFLAAAGAFAAATVALFAVSRGKWSDALVDSGREWIVPDALASGDLLYRDVVYWFGPFTPYFHASFFALLGSSFRTLVIAGVVGSLGALAALNFALRGVAGRCEAALWTALAVPALVFMPNGGGSILGMGYRMWHAAAFALLAVAAISRPRPARAAAVAGVLSAVAGLCRTEWGIAALLSCAVVVTVRPGFDAAALRNLVLMGATAVLAFGGVLGSFVLVAGADAVLRDGPVLLLGLPEETRANVALAGVRGWRSGLVPLLYSFLMWLGVVLTVEVVARRGDDPKKVRRRVTRLLGILAVLAVVALVGGGSGAVTFAAAPVVCFAALVAGLRRRTSPEGPPLAGFGLLGLLLSHRAFFHVSDGPYVAPPLLFAFVCAAGLLRIFATRAPEAASSRGLRTGLLATVAGLACFAFAGRFLHYASDERVPVPGTEGMLSARAETAREIVALASVIREETREGDGLVVLPEGEILNYLSGRRNPIRHKLYLPGYVRDANEPDILREFGQEKPTAVVIWNRPTGEYGRGNLGSDYGRTIARWIDIHYIPLSSPIGAVGGRPAGRIFRTYRRK